MAMAKDPEDRFTTTDELAAALEFASRGGETSLSTRILALDNPTVVSIPIPQASEEGSLSTAPSTHPSVPKPISHQGVKRRSPFLIPGLLLLVILCVGTIVVSGSAYVGAKGAGPFVLLTQPSANPTNTPTNTPTETPVPTDTQDQNTKFTELKGTYTITNGVFRNNDLTSKSPVMELTGKGYADFPKEYLDYTLNVKLLNSLRIDENSQGTDYRGKEIPYTIKGKFSELSQEANITKVLEQEVKKKISEKIDDKLGDKLNEKLGDELGDKLKGFLKGF